MPDSEFVAQWPGGDLNARMQLNGFANPYGEGMFNMESWLDRLYNYKQRGAAEEWKRNAATMRLQDQLQQQRGEREREVARQDAQPEAMPFRDMMQRKSLLDRDLYSANGTRINQGFQNLPMAASMSGFQLPQSGWDLYAKMLAGAGPSMGASIEGSAASQRNALGGQESQADMAKRMYGDWRAPAPAPTKEQEQGGGRG